MKSVYQVIVLVLCLSVYVSALGCTCKDLVNEDGYGNCLKDYECYVNQPSSCTDLQDSGIYADEKYSPAEACRPYSGCTCKNLVNEDGYGNCLKDYECYVNQPSVCTDLEDSKIYAGEKYSKEEACTRKEELSMGPCNGEVHYDGKCIRKVIDQPTLETQGIGAYIGGTYTCDNVRARYENIKWMDANNKRWEVKWGSRFTSLCFPGVHEVHFSAGDITERQGFDQATQWLCCSFEKKEAEGGRNAYTKICCKAMRKGSGVFNSGGDVFGSVLSALDTGASWAAALAPLLVAG